MTLLDTHIVWWLAYAPNKLSTQATRAIEDSEFISNGLAISCATIYELAWAIERGRMTISEGSDLFFKEIERRFKILPVDNRIAIEAARIAPPFHGDPMDRLIVATALASDRTLITADRSILASKVCKLLW